LGISPLSEKIIEYRNKWKAHLQRMEHTRIPLQAYKYQPPENETQVDQEEDGERQQYYRPEQEILLIHEVMMIVHLLPTAI
jgi:hypothetical protein